MAMMIMTMLMTMLMTMMMTMMMLTATTFDARRAQSSASSPVTGAVVSINAIPCSSDHHHHHHHHHRQDQYDHHHQLG